MNHHENNEQEEKQHRTYEEDLMYPVHEQPFSHILKSIPKRLLGLISKLLGVKMFMFFVATYLMYISIFGEGEGFPWYAWLIVYIATLFGWDGLRWIKEIRK